MSFQLLYWVLMLLWLVFGLWAGWPATGAAGPAAFRPLGGTLLLFILLVILGWQVFGSPVHP
jgi:hypothetical protein